MLFSNHQAEHRFLVALERIAEGLSPDSQSIPMPDYKAVEERILDRMDREVVPALVGALVDALTSYETFMANVPPGIAKDSVRGYFIGFPEKAREALTRAGVDSEGQPLVKVNFQKAGESWGRMYGGSPVPVDLWGHDYVTSGSGCDICGLGPNAHGHKGHPILLPEGMGHYLHKARLTGPEPAPLTDIEKENQAKNPTCTLGGHMWGSAHLQEQGHEGPNSCQACSARRPLVMAKCAIGVHHMNAETLNCDHCGAPRHLVGDDGCVPWCEACRVERLLRAEHGDEG